ncbi:FLOT1 protein, partial [Eurystomus gularis]|nr:FLOT1 protein [Eurystomus gularis]
QEIYKDRQKFSEQVFNVASSDLVNMGISVVSYTLKDIHDDQVTPGGHRGGDMGGRRGHWDGDGDTGMVMGTLGWNRSHHNGCNVPRVDAQKSRDHLDRVEATTEGWGHLQCPRGGGCDHVARTKQQIEEQRAQVLVVERAQQAQLQEHEIGRRQRELEATVRKPAEAERYRLECLAEAQR